MNTRAENLFDPFANADKLEEERRIAVARLQGAYVRRLDREHIDRILEEIVALEEKWHDEINRLLK